MGTMLFFFFMAIVAYGLVYWGLGVIAERLSK